MFKQSFVVTALLAIALSAAPVTAQLSGQLGILDLDANGGINPATGAAWQAGDAYRLAFVTTGTIPATSDDIATYNTFVQTAANNSTAFANLGSVAWSAIASTATDDARDNTSTNPNTNGVGEAIFLMDGTQVIAENYAELWDGGIDTQLDLTEEGTLRALDTPIWAPWAGVWTGTGNNGTASTPLGDVSGNNARLGLSRAELHFWVSRSTNVNTHALALYGLSEVLTIGSGCSPGDTDGDGDIDTGDLTTAITNFTGAGGSGKTCADGDTDDDGDVDTGDLTFSITNFTGAQAQNVGVPDLVYDPATGNVTIDADGTDVISFSLQPGPFNAADFSELPAGLTDNIANQIGWTSFNLFTGLTGTVDLGPILPAGLDLNELQASLLTATYGLALSGGGGGGRMDIIIPEPGAMVLVALGAVALGRRRRAA